MDINKNLSLILKDTHLYDIKACHYTIMNSLGFSLDGIDPNDKIGRNIKIGQMMRDNPRITSLLRNTTASIIDDYILKNNIKENEIVIRQYDGIILTRLLQYTHIGHIPLERRDTYSNFISSIDRKKYIAIDNNNDIHIKGISHRYKKMDQFYIRLCNIVGLTQDRIYQNLQKIKDEIYTSEDSELFGIPADNKKYTIFLKGYGAIEISSSTLRILDTESVDREKYFKLYIEPFTKSIVFENVRRK